MTTKTRTTTFISKIRHVLRDFNRAPEGMFTFDRELGDGFRRDFHR